MRENGVTKFRIRQVCQHAGLHRGHLTPDCLFCDNGPEFRSTSMKATEALLNMRIVDLEPRRLDLKGKIERWFRTLNQELLHLQPGTTYSSPRERLHYDSTGEAVLTLADVD